MNMEAAMIIGTIGGICGMVGLFLGLVCVAAVVGFKNSTHSVQYVPFDNTNVLNEELKEDNEEALFNKVGRKSNKKEAPTVLENLDSTIEQINKSDLTY